MTRIRHQIPIPEMDGDPDNDRVWCAWSDCDNPGSGLITAVECFANPGISNHGEHPRRPECSECRRLAFCCAQHLDFYMRSHRPGAFGRLSAGTNARYL
jgi:hypothetical protein